jgi:hypothetical protein
MKSVFAVLALVLSTNAAMADGFVCKNAEELLTVKVYNNTQPAKGTRSAAAMILSSDAVQLGNKTIATFADSTLTLGNQGPVYTANVDHRFNASGRKGELVGGTNIGALKYVVLDVNFSYAQPKANGSRLSAILTLIKRNGAQIDLAMDCVRYLKH